MKKALDWKFIKSSMAIRREYRKLRSLGYKKHETDWEIIRGPKHGQVIVDVKISVDKKHVWTKVGPREEA